MDNWAKISETNNIKFRSICLSMQGKLNSFTYMFLFAHINQLCCHLLGSPLDNKEL